MHSLSLFPKIMGILNISPHSFATQGRFISPQEALQHAKKMVSEGASIIDVGAEPTHPGSHPCVSLQEELDRLLPVVELLAREIDVPISIDTSKAQVMREVIKAGASMINDVRALREEGAMTAVAELNVPVCLMHMAFPHGKPTPDAKIETENIIDFVKSFLIERIDSCLKAGIKKENIIIDPGIGHGNFGKDLQQNLMLLTHLDRFFDLNLPILIGLSRKTFVGEILNVGPDDRLIGSVIAAVYAATHGVSFLRVHDVKETIQALKMSHMINTIRNQAATVYDTGIKMTD